jgi:anti-sigma factor RsiW
LVTCKDFLTELNDFLDGAAQDQVRRELEEHLEECPNCWVICDTTKKTIEVYKGMDAFPIPVSVHDRLMAALQKKCESRKTRV